MTKKNNLKAFVRIDGKQNVVAGSLILRKKRPTVGRWQEIEVNQCCTTTTSTTTVLPAE